MLKIFFKHPAFLLTTAENLPETFEQTNLSDEVIKQLQKLETIYPTTIQAKAIPIILQGFELK